MAPCRRGSAGARVLVPASPELSTEDQPTPVGNLYSQHMKTAHDHNSFWQLLRGTASSLERHAILQRSHNHGEKVVPPAAEYFLCRDAVRLFCRLRAIAVCLPAVTCAATGLDNCLAPNERMSLSDISRANIILALPHSAVCPRRRQKLSCPTTALCLTSEHGTVSGKETSAKGRAQVRNYLG